MKELTAHELNSLQVEKPFKEAMDGVRYNIDHIAKPLDSFGTFEDILVRLGGIYKTTDLSGITKARLIIMCADNGVVSENVTQSGQDVTSSVAFSMGRRESSVCILARENQVDVEVIDIGIADSKPIEGVLNMNVRKGTRNLAKEPALTDSETLKAISVGIDAVKRAKEAGFGVVLTGEMGIGNTTTSAIIIATLLGLDAKAVTGRGAGLDDTRLANKIKVVSEAIAREDKAKPFDLLRDIGGLDIAGLAGVCIGGAIYHVPVVLDGVIALAAALVANSIVPGVADYVIASHAGKEPAIQGAVNELGLKPVIDGRLAAGEGTGAVMMYGLIRMVYMVYRDAASFGRINVEEYTRQC